MLVHLSDVVSQEGKCLKTEIPLALETIVAVGDTYKVVEQKPLKLMIVNTGDKVLELKGRTDVVVRIPCSRCLEAVDWKFSLEIERKLDMKQSEEDRIKNLDESDYITGMDLDGDRLVCDEILIQWPLKVLCKEDCKGICSKCGQNLNHGECDCEKGSLDPRMAAISDIFSKFKEV